MKCQLARYTNPGLHPERKGWLVWVKVEHPYFTNTKSYETNRDIECISVFDSPYYNPLDSGPLVITTERVELLPFFDDIPPCSWEDWIARGGEQLPLEESPYA